MQQFREQDFGDILHLPFAYFLYRSVSRVQCSVSVATWPTSRKKTGDTAVQQNSTYPDAGYPDRHGPSGKFVENSITLTCLANTGYRIQLWLLEIQIRRGRVM